MDCHDLYLLELVCWHFSLQAFSYIILLVRDLRVLAAEALGSPYHPIYRSGSVFPEFCLKNSHVHVSPFHILSLASILKTKKCLLQKSYKDFIKNFIKIKGFYHACYSVQLTLSSWVSEIKPNWLRGVLIPTGSQQGVRYNEVPSLKLTPICQW